jgi:hypothetical protein
MPVIPTSWAAEIVVQGQLEQKVSGMSILTNGVWWLRSVIPAKRAEKGKTEV